MLPGVGIFGSDPVSKILIQILKHFEFEIHAIWTNNFEIENYKKLKSGESESKNNLFPKLITNSIDNVLLNKNVNLVFVCCQPNLHSQISTKALGIGKNVICLFPTCKEIDEIQHMINSARYYPSLMSSISYGGLKFLSEFKLLKQSMPLVGDLKVCNIVINCQNLVLARNSLYNTMRNESGHERQGSLSSLIDNIDFIASSSSSSSSINWLSDKDLGAGVLNRFGAAMISFILNLFDNKNKVTKVFGSLRTFIEDFDQINDNNDSSKKYSIRKITADDHCTFQLNLEPGSIVINVSINSLAQTKYSQEISLCGNRGVLVWNDSKIIFRSSNKIKVNSIIEQQKSFFSPVSAVDKNNNVTFLDKNNNNCCTEELVHYETELFLDEPVDQQANIFLDRYKNCEEKCPEMPLLFIRGLYFYLRNVKKQFLELEKIKKATENSGSSLNLSQSPNKSGTDLENFEHTRLVQMIIKKICLSSIENRWITVNY